MKKEEIIKLPKNIMPGKEIRTVSIDTEIIKEIKWLWKNKIQTLGCCSGHRKENPSVVIADGYDKTEIKKIVKLLAMIDNKKWDILQWQVKKVN